MSLAVRGAGSEGHQASVPLLSGVQLTLASWLASPRREDPPPVPYPSEGGPLSMYLGHSLRNKVLRSAVHTKGDPERSP